MIKPERDKDDIQEEIKSLEKGIKELQDELEQKKGLTQGQKLATFLHQKTCRWNHVDGCSWDYTSWNNPDSTRLKYLRKAEQMLIEDDFVTIKRILKNI